MELLDPTAPTPLLTADLPGTGGAIKQQPEDFVVEEVLGREPAGNGEHLLLWIEKRGLSAESMMRRLAEALGVAAGEIGTAGLKDTRAVTRQWVSVPATAEPRVAAIDDPDLEVLEARRDTGKLRAGQLAGNRFDVLIRAPEAADAPERAAAIVERLRAVGLLAYYGHQRFGRDGQTARDGLALLKGERRIGRGFHRKLALSAAQAWLFNTWLEARHREGRLLQLIPGEVIEDRRTRLPSWVGDPAAAQARFDDGRIVPMGPIFGPRMRRAKGEAQAREAAVLQAAGLDLEAFAAQGKLCLGTRRPILVPVNELEVTEESGGLRLRFELPSGVYATVLLAEVTKAEGG